MSPLAIALGILIFFTFLGLLYYAVVSLGPVAPSAPSKLTYAGCYGGDFLTKDTKLVYALSHNADTCARIAKNIGSPTFGISTNNPNSGMPPYTCVLSPDNISLSNLSLGPGESCKAISTSQFTIPADKNYESSPTNFPFYVVS